MLACPGFRHVVSSHWHCRWVLQVVVVAIRVVRVSYAYSQSKPVIRALDTSRGMELEYQHINIF